MQTGQFFPTSNYTNDISLMFDGTHKIYPSRYAVFKSNIDMMQDIKNIVERPTKYTDYNDIRYSIFQEARRSGRPKIIKVDFPRKENLNNYFEDEEGKIKTTDTEIVAGKTYYKKRLDGQFVWGAPDIPKIEEVDGEFFAQKIPNFNRLVGIGDINFLSHDTYGGMVYTETYVNVSPADLKKCVYMAGTEGGNKLPEITTTIFNIDNADNPEKINPGLDDNTATFDVVVLFYNIYPASADATKETEAIAIDLPMGIYVLHEPQKLIVKTDTLYGSGTSWATRICSRFVSTALLNGNVDINPREEDYNTLAKILTEFGKISSQVGQVLNQKTGNLQTIKSYLDEFKNNRNINVPYIIGSHWYVNGRDIGAIVSNEVIDEAIATYMTSDNISPELLASIKGEPGAPGEPGKDGADGVSPRVVSYTYPNDQNQTITEDWWFIGETPICPVNSRVEIINGQWYINGVNQGVQATGDTGATPKLEIRVYEGVNSWFVSYDDGATWTYLGAAQGESGTDGSTPYITDVDGVAYWFIDGVNTGHKVDADTVGIIDNYWYINGQNTGVLALGETGAQGAPGPKGDKGDTGDTGSAGAPGVGISSITMFYNVTADPDQSPSTWAQNPPIMSADYPYLWTRMRIIYTDGRVFGTQPVISGIYNTAKIINLA